MFLRIVFSLFIFSCFCFLFPPGSTAFTKQKQHSLDSLRSFPENFLPAHTATDELIRHTAYTLCYSEKQEQAKWVAYHLTGEMCNNNGEERTNNFREDLDVKTRSAIPDDYKKSGYDRGHLCPAGDMGWSEQTMSESFLMSNMSPQVPGFNRGIWKNLEGDVRQWAIDNKDIYVVTAGVLEDNLATIGRIKWRCRIIITK
ncbi:MAG: non-specific endonuclease [Bacteroidetes bacterium]|nr:non-specific endonuclease [Bacteroidota bacterium]